MIESHKRLVGKDPVQRDPSPDRSHSGDPIVVEVCSSEEVFPEHQKCCHYCAILVQGIQTTTDVRICHNFPPIPIYSTCILTHMYIVARIPTHMYIVARIPTHMYIVARIPTHMYIVARIPTHMYIVARIPTFLLVETNYSAFLSFFSQLE